MITHFNTVYFVDISEHPYYTYGIAYGQISVLQVHDYRPVKNTESNTLRNNSTNRH